MINPSVSHLSDTVLRRDLHAIVAQDRSTTARMLIHIAEFESRGLYRNEGYATMHLYCVGELGMSEDIAYKRTRAARKAREFPRIFLAIADGRLTLSAVGLLVRYLTAETAEDLLTGAERKTNAQVEELLAQRFPEPDSPTLVQAIHQQERLAVRPIVNSGEQLSELDEAPPVPLVPSPIEQRPKVKPLSPQRYALQLTMSESMHDKLRRAQDLLGHQIPSGDVVQVLDRALDALICKLEKRKFAATSKPRSRKAAATTSDSRHIPAAVQRAVWERDGGRCTFVSDTGHRCSTRKRLEFDHIQEIARGGESTSGNIRLLCHAHNQYAAEQTYGPRFMKARRQEAAEKRAATAAAKKRVEEVIPYLRELGCRADEARYAAQCCERIPDAPLVERVRLAVRQLGPRGCRPRGAANAAATAPSIAEEPAPI